MRVLQKISFDRKYLFAESLYHPLNGGPLAHNKAGVRYSDTALQRAGSKPTRHFGQQRSGRYQGGRDFVPIRQPQSQTMPVTTDDIFERRQHSPRGVDI
jgi:hypothetical protein